jgi:cytochrome P450
MTMLLAGHDTTALSLTYTWFLLSEHPEVERRFHEELDTVLGGGSPTAAEARKLGYTNRVLTEAMRLYPPVYTLFRETVAPMDLAGYDVPAGSLLMLPQWGVHRDSRWYDDPEEFDPDRWLPERAEKRHRFAYFPFGGGSRSCIGRQFSLLEATLILATVGREYRLERVGEGPLDLRPSLTMHPADGMAMRVHRR